MDIVVNFDHNFVMPTGVMLHSVCVNNPDVDITFHVLSDDRVTNVDKEDIKKIIHAIPKKTIAFYSIDCDIAQSFPRLLKTSLPPVTYFRLFLTSILPESIEKVLYLDGDIVVRQSLQPLWDTDLSNYAIAAVSDRPSERPEMYSRLQYSSDLGYFNAGVLLINLRYWREHDVTPAFVEYIQGHSDILLFQDQDVLNYIFRDKKLLLPLKYNFQQALLQRDIFQRYENEILAAIKDPVIIHYSGVVKPWHAYIRDLNPLNSSFFKYQNQTKWAGRRIDPRPLSLRVKNSIADVMRSLKIIAPREGQITPIPPVD